MIAVRVGKTPRRLASGSLQEHELPTRDMGEVQKAIWCRMACGFQEPLAFKHKNYFTTHIYIRKQV
jgi:hypothetical protein